MGVGQHIYVVALVRLEVGLVAQHGVVGVGIGFVASIGFFLRVLLAARQQVGIEVETAVVDALGIAAVFLEEHQHVQLLHHFFRAFGRRAAGGQSCQR